MHTIKLTPTFSSIAIGTLFCLFSCGGGGSSPSPNFVTPSTPTETPSAQLPQPDISAILAKDPGSTLPANWQKGVFMEIYVRGYQDSNGDGIGDLRGLIERLDYLQNLGIKGIWLMPVTQSEDKDHGYAVKDYRAIEANYGTLEDFDNLIKEAHARGIGIIIDYVMNHSATTHPLFINSADTSTNAYRDWYVWNERMPSGWNIFGNNPWYSTKNGAYFAAFYSGMPDFNLRNPATLEYHQNNLRFWLNRGVDGFRFDAVGNLVENGAGAWESQPESIAIMGQVHQNLANYSKRYLVCEAPANPAAFTVSSACGSAFAFNHNHDIVNAAKGQASAIDAVARYFVTANPDLATMISNHDEFAGERLWNAVNGDLAQYRLAAATLLLQPGTPFIYYGEEVGMAASNTLTGDAKLRTPMSWTNDTNHAGFTTTKPFRSLSANVEQQNLALELNDVNSIYSFYKSMIALRNARPSLQMGDYQQAEVIGSTLVFRRRSGSETSLILINYGSTAASIALKDLGPNSAAAALYPSKAAALSIDSNGRSALTIEAQSIRVFDLK